MFCISKAIFRLLLKFQNINLSNLKKKSHVNAVTVGIHINRGQFNKAGASNLSFKFKTRKKMVQFSLTFYIFLFETHIFAVSTRLLGMQYSFDILKEKFTFFYSQMIF